MREDILIVVSGPTTTPSRSSELASEVASILFAEIASVLVSVIVTVITTEVSSVLASELPTHSRSSSPATSRRVVIVVRCIEFTVVEALPRQVGVVVAAHRASHARSTPHRSAHWHAFAEFPIVFFKVSWRRASVSPHSAESSFASESTRPHAAAPWRISAAAAHPFFAALTHARPASSSSSSSVLVRGPGSSSRAASSNFEVVAASSARSRPSAASSSVPSRTSSAPSASEACPERRLGLGLRLRWLWLLVADCAVVERRLRELDLEHADAALVLDVLGAFLALLAEGLL